MNVPPGYSKGCEAFERVLICKAGTDTGAGGGDRPPSFLTHSSTLEHSTVPDKGLDYVSPPQFLRGSTGPGSKDEKM